MPLSTQDLKDLIVNDAIRLGNDPALMLALADHESAGFNPNALSPTGVRGLFQVTNKTGAPYGQTPQTRSDPTVSSDVGQRHFKDLLHQAGGNVDTALRWYNGGSDPQFAQRVQAKVAGHRASLTTEPSQEELHQAVYGSTPAPGAAAPEAEPTQEELHQAVYGTPAPTPAAADTAAPLGVQPARWTVTIDPGGGAQPDRVEVPGQWQDAVDTVTQLKGQYRPGTRFDIGPVPTEPAPSLPPPSDPRLAAKHPPPGDPPLEDSLNPAELVVSGYGAKGAQLLTRNAGKLVKLGAEGLGLEVGHKVNQAVGNTPGSLTDFGWPDVANFVIPPTLEGVVQTGKGLLRLSRAGRAVQAADTATTAQRADYNTSLAAAEAAHTTQEAADRVRLMPDGSVPPVTPVPATLQSLRSGPPAAVEPTLKESGADPYRRLGELGTGILSAVYSGHPIKSLLVGAGVAGADKGYEAFSRWLLSPEHLPAFRQAMGPSGALDPRKMAVLSELFRASVQPESPAGP